MYPKLLFSIFLWLVCLSSKAQLSKTSTELTRNIGNAVFQYRIDPSGKGVLCKFLWKDSIAGIVHLERSLTSAVLNFGNPGQQGSCLLNLKFPDDITDIMQLNAQILSPATAQRDSSQNFIGLVAAWLPAGSSATNHDSVIYQLTPIVTVVVKPLGNAKNNASVAIYSGSLLAFTSTLTQTAPVITYDSDIIIGDMKIEKGMQLTLQIPSTVQMGSVRLLATFSSSTIPPTRFNAFVATWELK